MPSTQWPLSLVWFTARANPAEAALLSPHPRLRRRTPSRVGENGQQVPQDRSCHPASVRLLRGPSLGAAGGPVVSEGKTQSPCAASACGIGNKFAHVQNLGARLAKVKGGNLGHVSFST